MNTALRQIRDLVMGLAAGYVIVLLGASLVGLAAAVPVSSATLEALGGHSGLFGFVIVFAIIFATSAAAFLLAWFVFKTWGRSTMFGVAVVLIWVWSLADGQSMGSLRTAHAIAQFVLALLCVPLAIVWAAAISRRRGVNAP